MNTKEPKFNEYNICYCKFCGKECKSINSLKQHECRCKENPNRYINKGNGVGNKTHRVSWNKGKTKETDERIRKQGETYSANIKSGKIVSWCKGKTKETDERIRNYSEKISNSIKNKIDNNEWHLSFSKSRTIEYNNNKFQGKWEVEFAKYLDSLNIEWIRPSKKFDYIYKDKICKYLPDFYLPKYNLYIEIKGYPTKRDYAKWENFPDSENLDIFFGDELEKLNIVDNAKNVYLNVPEIYRKKHINFLNI